MRWRRRTPSCDGAWHRLCYTLAQRLKDKAEQVWLFTKNFGILWTNNASEQALKSPKRHQAVAGYWRTLDTLCAELCIRSYLATTRAHNIQAIDAIHTALTSKPWFPQPQPDAIMRTHP